MKKFFSKYLLIPANIVVVTMLWFSGWSVNIDPNDFVIPAFLGLTYPIILLANLFFILLWLLFNKRYMLISIIGIFLSFSTFSNFFQINLKNEKNIGETIKVMTYNVRLFDLYNWSENKSTRNKIFGLLDEADADIYCFQEFYQVDRKGVFTTRDTLITFLRANNYREAYTHKMRGNQYFGVATFSAYPIINSGVIEFSNDINNVCLYSDLKIKEDTIRVYNMHIASIRFSHDDYDFVEKANYKQDEKELKKGLKTIYHRLSDAFKKRSDQTKKVLAHINESPYETIVCGDFNDTPISFCYNSFSEYLIDSFKEAGNGIGNSYAGTMPSYRIDYIFHSERFKAHTYTTDKRKYSDHYPVIVELALDDDSESE